jgi:hypothetical protein
MGAPFQWASMLVKRAGLFYAGDLKHTVPEDGAKHGRKVAIYKHWGF